MASVFEKFGGIRPMAAKVGLPPSTVKSWHVNRKIPAWRHSAILDVAKQHAIEVELSELENIACDTAAAQDAAA